MKTPTSNISTEPVSPARQRVLTALKRHGPLRAGQIARMLGMTSVAARQHLTALDSAGYLTCECCPPEGRGRPAIVWSLSEKAQGVFPDRHAELTVGLLDAMRKAVGDEGVKRIVEVRATDQVAQYRTAIPGQSASLRKRVETLAHLRTAEGYMAEVREESPGVYLLIEHHCPICDAAKCCTGLCDAELDVFQRSLGESVSIRRVEHALSGDRRCTYRIEAAS